MDNDLLVSVDGFSCPCPSSFTWGLHDNSASDAGRVQDDNDTMYKNRTSQKRTLSVGWNGVNREDAARILQMFNPEYISVTYWDSMDGKLETRQFYTGDKTTPVKIWTVNNKRYEQISFEIIER